MKKILLVYPKPKLNKSPRFGFSIQLLQISSILKNNGFDVNYLDFSYEKYDKYKFLNYIKTNNIEAVVVEIDSFALKRSENNLNAFEILELSKKMNIKTIAFGYDCIMDGDDIPNADYIIKNSLFNIILKLLKINSNIDYDLDYDSLPYPDREILLTNDFFRKNSNSTLIRTAEGCLNSCTFCQRRGWQNSYKKHSMNYVIDEFRHLRKSNYQNVWITDENFTFDLNRAKSILQQLIDENLTNGMKISISSWTNIDFEFLKLAKKANISIISMGIESANEEILDFYRKKINLEQTKELIAFADSIGIYMVGNFIIGAPMETFKTISNTFNYISNSKLDQVNIKILDYMIGSKLYGDLKFKKLHHYFACSENGLCEFILKELTDIKNDFLKSFYLNKENILKKKIARFGEPYYPLVK